MNLDWRPPGWSTDPSIALVTVAAAGLAAAAKRKRREALTDAEVAALSDLALLRQCYCTPRWVWDLAGFLLGVKPGEWSGDPFHNEWSHAREFLAPDAWTKDGIGDAPKNDGFRTIHMRYDIAVKAYVVDEEKTWKQRRPAEADETWVGLTAPVTRLDHPAWPGDGPLLVNGPHRKGSRGLTGWVPLAARAGRLRKVAAVVPTDCVSWFVEHGMRCDAEVCLGRMDYDLVPGLPKISGNERCSSLLLWDPETRGEQVQSTMIEVRDDRGRLLRLPLRPGLGPDPHVLVVPRGRSESST